MSSPYSVVCGDVDPCRAGVVGVAAGITPAKGAAAVVAAGAPVAGMLAVDPNC